MSKKLGQEPAFPALEHNESGYGNQITLYFDGQRQFIPFTKGISIRLYLAGMAMQGLMANDNVYPETEEHYKNIAVMSLCMADELLKQETEE